MRLELKIVRDDGTVLVVAEPVLNLGVSPMDEFSMDLSASIVDERARHALTRLAVKFSRVNLDKERRLG